MPKTPAAARSLNADPLLIRRVDAIPVSMPLVKPVLMGGGQRYVESETLVVRIEAVNGLIGWGEASAAPTMTGDTLPGMVAAVERHGIPGPLTPDLLLRGDREPPSSRSGHERGHLHERE